MEEKLYKAEAVPFPELQYADNQPCIELIEKPPMGIFRLLDSQGKTPKATDATFCDAVVREHGRHPCLVRPARRARDEQDHFVVRHYAGQVAYSCAGFIEKNNDSLDADFVQQLCDSRLALVRQLGEGARAKADTTLAESGRAAANATVSRRFTADLSSLVAELGKSTAHFVRCIKPNGGAQPLVCEPELVMEQLRCNGTLEAVQLMRHGFPTRVPYDLISDRYRKHLSSVPGVAQACPRRARGPTRCIQQDTPFRLHE
eukprot:5102935-Prymnesium_polylepis.1